MLEQFDCILNFDDMVTETFDDMVTERVSGSSSSILHLHTDTLDDEEYKDVRSMDTVSCSATTGVSSRCKWAGSVPHILSSFCLLWFAEYRHWPLVEIAFTLLCFLGGFSLGIIGRCMTDPRNLDTANLHRIPFLINCCIAGVTKLWTH